MSLRSNNHSVSDAGGAVGGGGGGDGRDGTDVFDSDALLSFPEMNKSGNENPPNGRSDHHHRQSPHPHPPQPSPPPQHNNSIQQSTSDGGVSSPPSYAEGMMNKRLSWAQRRLTRTRSDSSSQFTGDSDFENHETPSGFQYEEFMKDSVPCPSCGGGGRIDRDTESKLVALIPYDDERLKPRRTWQYVAIGICVSVLLALLTLFFLFPRAVKMSSEGKRLTPKHVEINLNSSSPFVFLTIQNEFSVENSNYVPVSFESLTMRVTVFEQTLNSTTNATLVTVPLRSSIRVYATIDLNFKNALSFIAPYCADKRRWMHTFLFHFDVAAQASILNHSQDMTFSVFQYVSCGHDDH